MSLKVPEKDAEIKENTWLLYPCPRLFGRGWAQKQMDEGALNQWISAFTVLGFCTPVPNPMEASHQVVQFTLVPVILLWTQV